MLKKKEHAESAHDDFANDVLHSLSQPERSISSKWLYDNVGSALFEKITKVEDYYLTRTEVEIFENVFSDLEEMGFQNSSVVEFGSGASVKTQKLLAALSPEAYVPIDIAEEFLQEAAEKLHQKFPKIAIAPLVADLTSTYELPHLFTQNTKRLGFFPGSTIGNFTKEIAGEFLSNAKAAMGPGAHLLISADLIKDHDVLWRAYNDSDGVSAEFTLNLLTRMNNELNANFDVSEFKHFADFNVDKSRIEIYFEALSEQSVTIAGRELKFTKGERVRTEYSYKYSKESFENLLAQSGWELQKMWSDKNDWFGVFLARAKD